METHSHQPTAVILQFPVKGRATARTFPDAQRTVEDQRWSKICAAALDGCWYHDEAVRDAGLH